MFGQKPEHREHPEHPERVLIINLVRHVSWKLCLSRKFGQKPEHPEHPKHPERVMETLSLEKVWAKA
jgi:hypothetical protein